MLGAGPTCAAQAVTLEYGLERAGPRAR